MELGYMQTVPASVTALHRAERRLDAIEQRLSRLEAAVRALGGETSVAASGRLSASLERLEREGEV